MFTWKSFSGHSLPHQTDIVVDELVEAAQVHASFHSLEVNDVKVCMTALGAAQRTVLVNVTAKMSPAGK